MKRQERKERKKKESVEKNVLFESEKNAMEE
jgi:hypothetical protein